MKLYDWLLAVYPRRIRERFGDGMRATFAEDYARERARGPFRTVLFLVATTLHTLAAGAAERLPRSTTVRSFLSADVRDAVRSLLATPLVTTVAILSLALGIGANTALYSILYSLVLKPLPVAEPHRLAVLVGPGWTNPIWEEIRERRLALFADAFAWSRERFNLASSGRVDPVEGGYVSGTMFPALGITPLIGRLLTPADDVRGGGAFGHAAVISHRFWTQRLAGRPDVLGSPITVNGTQFAVVGVTPPGFLGPDVGQAMDLFLPLASEAAIRGAESALDGRSSWWLEIMIRLKPGQTLDAATAVLNAARPGIREATIPLDANAERRAGYLKEHFTLASAATGVSSLRNRFAQPLVIILAVVAAVLLIACANIANVMLARAASRRHEMSIRLALGASRARLGSQLFVESLLLGFTGAAAGLAVARIGAVLLVGQLGSGAVTLDLTIDGHVLAFTAALALTATFLFGVAPVLGLSRVKPNEALKEHNRSVAGEHRVSVRNALVVAQVALSFALIWGAALFVRTFTTLVTTPLGFDPERLLIVSVDARHSQPADEDQVSFYQRVADAVAGVPGVARGSLSFMTPMSGRGWNNRVEVSGGPVLAGRDQVTWINAVAPGWFETYGMRLLAGRDFARSDVAGGERVVIVNESFVRRFVGSEGPIGQRVKGISRAMPDMLIIGVVNDAVYRSARSGVAPTMYLPMTQAGPFGAGFSVTARIAAEQEAVERGVTDAISRIDPRLTVAFRDYSDQIRATVVQERLVALLSGFFGVLAMLLSALGLYGVTSYSVSRRRPELAVRIALGASATGVVRLVLGRVATLLLLGIAIGAGVILWAGGFTRALLFRVEPGDPITIGAAAAILIGVGLFAGWLPARRVSRLDPTLALRE